MIGVDSTFFANRTIGDIYSIDDFNGIPAIYVINYVENAGIPWTGCVATAMAQVMRYWQVPNTYNYSVIPLKAYTTGWNTTAVDEAGKILWDAGKSVCMNYGCNGSGAQMDDVNDGLKIILVMLVQII